MVSEGAVLALSCAAAESVRLRLNSAARSLCISPFPVVVVAMAGGSRRFCFVETRLAASYGENGDEGETCVLGMEPQGRKRKAVTSERVTAELRSAWTG